MSSNIDVTKPLSVSATTASVRANFLAAKTEIEALQALLTGTGAVTVQSLTVSTGNLTVSAGQGIFSNGTASAPGIRLSTANIGIFGVATLGGSLAFVANGVSLAAVTASGGPSGTLGFLIRADAFLGFSAGEPQATAMDVALSRNAANDALLNSHLSPTAATTNLRDLGKSTQVWRTGYFGTSVSVIGTVSGTGVVAVGNGTAPTAQTDTVALYSTDIAAGHTEPSFFCEGTQVLATGQADSVSSVRVKMRINGTEVTLLAI